MAIWSGTGPSGSMIAAGATVTVVVAGVIGYQYLGPSDTPEAPSPQVEIAALPEAAEPAPMAPEAASEPPAAPPAAPEAVAAPPETPEAPEVATAADPVPDEAAPPDPVTPDPIAPRFDLVRVDAAGGAVIAGRAEANADLRLRLDGEEIHLASSDGTGSFVAMLSIPRSELPQVLSLEMLMEGGSVLVSDQSVIISPTVATASAEPVPDASPVLPDPGAEVAAPQGTLSRDTAPGAPGTGPQLASPALQETGAPVGAGTVAADAAPDGDGPDAVTELALLEDEAPALPVAPYPVAGAADVSGAPVTTAPPAEVGPALDANQTVIAPDPVAVGPGLAEPDPDTAATGAGSGNADAGTGAAQTEITVVEAGPDGAAAATATAEPQVATADIASPTTLPGTTDTASDRATAEAGDAPSVPPVTAADTGSGSAGPVPPLSETAAIETALAGPEPSETALAEIEPATPDETAPPHAPTVMIADSQGIRVVQAGGPQPQVQVVLDTISYDLSGEVVLAGRGPARSDVRLYLDNQPVQLAQIDAGGGWSTQLPQVDPGTYTLRVDEVSAAGEVLSRVETPFLREEPEVLEALPQRDGVSVITVQPGHTLWGIARDHLGDGVLYVQVYQANRDLIRNPHWIYPGQIFAIPDALRDN